MTFLKAVPLWAWVIIALLIGLGVQEVRVRACQTETETAHKELSDYRAGVAESSRKAEAAAREEERRRQAAVDQVAIKAKEKIDAANADADGARIAADGLQREVNRLRASRSATCSAIAAGERKATGDAFSVLADVFQESVDRNRGLADALERSRVAGKACEAAYDGIR